MQLSDCGDDDDGSIRLGVGGTTPYASGIFFTGEEVTSDPEPIDMEPASPHSGAGSVYLTPVLTAAPMAIPDSVPINSLRTDSPDMIPRTDSPDMIQRTESPDMMDTAGSPTSPDDGDRTADLAAALAAALARRKRTMREGGSDIEESEDGEEWD